MSAMPVPATKAGQLIERLVKLSDMQTLDALEIKRIGREAKALLAVDAARGHSIFGCLAALEGDIEESHRRNRIALELDDDLTIRFNYSVSMSLLDENEAAFEVASRALERSDDDLGLLRHAIRVALESAHFRRADVLCHQLSSLAPDQPDGWRERARELAAAVEAGELREQTVRQLLEIVTAVQRREGVRTHWARFHADGGAFLYERGIFATPAVASRLNGLVADHIVDSPPLLEEVGTRFVVAFAGVVTDVGEP